jgi:hypothetical protein
VQILESKGFICATRGFVIIRDRKGLVELSGGASDVPELEYERLVGNSGLSGSLW